MDISGRNNQEHAQKVRVLICLSNNDSIDLSEVSYFEFSSWIGVKTIEDIVQHIADFRYNLATHYPRWNLFVQRKGEMRIIPSHEVHEIRIITEENGMHAAQFAFV
ncbi:MAG: hypothetical protein Q8O83_01860 [bacterium]|nr:hypothetical protein [bacterium]